MRGIRVTIASFGMAALVAVGAYFELFESESYQFLRSTNRLLMQLYPDPQIPKYNQDSIEILEQTMPDLESMLLAFDGNAFRAYSLGKKKELSFRYAKAIPLMVHALKTSFPQRFRSGQPVFQMVWTMGDYLRTTCVNKGRPCPHVSDLPPIVSYSAVHRDGTVLPTAKAFPNHHYISCMYDWKLLGTRTCRWQEVDTTLSWEELVPSIAWRGSDVSEFVAVYDAYKNINDSWMEESFTRAKLADMTATEIVDMLVEHWNDLSPRWRAVALTLKAKLSLATAPYWIDAMFTGSSNDKLHEIFADHELNLVDPTPADAKTMSKARYQIDLGGGGGTSGQGTLTKLQMPGVLLHHETPTKDWFENMLEPWKHYIPVASGLADMFSKWEWAQLHPKEAQAISQEASKLAETLLSEETMKQVYEDLFVTYLGKVVESYQPQEGRSWEDCLARYRSHRVGVHEVAQCSGKKCRSEWKPNTYVDFY